MVHPPLALETHSPEATARFAEGLGARLRPGDCLLLEGDIGAGKTHFARALIQSLLESPEDVPSPTFTLVQSYFVHPGELWHADLYRLSGPDEVEELGLTDAFAHAICLVEWPDRLGDLAPANALTLHFDTIGDNARRITAQWSDAKWADRLEGLSHG